MGVAGCRTTIWQLCKYYIVVGIGATIDFILFTILILSTPLHYILANAVSFMIVAIGVFFIQKNWTFQYRGNSTWIFAKYTSLLAFSYCMGSLVLFILVGVLLQNPILSKAIQIALGACWGYAISRYFVYR
jgi:putative flippase GtrA